jgi:hypothetical protein
VVLLLLCLTFAPFDKEDDYFYMSLSGQGAARSVYALSLESENNEMIAEDELDSHHICSCLLCMMTIGEIYTRMILPKKVAWELASFSLFPAIYAYYHEIYHPPRT